MISLEKSAYCRNGIIEFDKKIDRKKFVQWFFVYQNSSKKSNEKKKLQNKSFSS